ncbi:hypothetical protein EDC44_10631 [Cricetibacter osteomyelitidis]|uniref:Lipoprotein n=1 Tax=Cricetibacter osteomyelitidis TaxID=1521931 RepID=A0A4R2TM67_9PAST|nr:hypothetical protein [Cricetibacter osteomyelitidis]TCP95972.1 hypothetical protein EDC44_10631 [Cricetibacter osteomyelitidis]
MKLIKLLPAILAATVISACSTAAMKEDAKALEVQPKMTEKAIAYNCIGKKHVVINYTFADQKAVSATVMLNKKSLGETFMRNDINADSASFVSGDYVLNVENPLSLDTVEVQRLINIYRSTKDSDEIQAKVCNINKKATAKLAK